MTVFKKTYRALQLDTALVTVFPQQFVIDRKIRKGDQFEAMWSSDSSVIVYRLLNGGEVERERLAEIVRLQKNIEAIDKARAELQKIETTES